MENYFPAYHLYFKQHCNNQSVIKLLVFRIIFLRLVFRSIRCYCSVAEWCLTLCNPMNCSTPGSSVRGILENTGMDCHFLVQGIFPDQRFNPHLLHWQADSLSPSSQRSHICVCVCACVKFLQLCLTLCDHMDCSPPGSSVNGILQARILEWIAMPSFR